MLSNTVKLQEIYGYAAGTEAAVAHISADDKPAIATVGSNSNSQNTSGDQAFWVRWKTPAKTSKGKPIYLRKYFHGFAKDATDGIANGVRSAATIYAGKMTDGTLPGGFAICAPQGAPGGISKVPSFTTTRTLKRRGADPS